jgi:DNA-binding winged helix-turn-helix (wHTH) protein
VFLMLGQKASLSIVQKRQNAERERTVQDQFNLGKTKKLKMLPSDHLSKENVILRYQLEEALARIVYLEGLLTVPRGYPQNFNLGSKEIAVLNCLCAARGVCSNIRLLEEAGYGEEYRNPTIIKVVVHWLRKKLAPLNIEIATVWGEGYMIDAKNRAKLHAAIAANVSLMSRREIQRQRLAVA